MTEDEQTLAFLAVSKFKHLEPWHVLESYRKCWLAGMDHETTLRTMKACDNPSFGLDHAIKVWQYSQPKPKPKPLNTRLFRFIRRYRCHGQGAERDFDALAQHGTSTAAALGLLIALRDLKRAVVFSLARRKQWRSFPERYPSNV